MHPLRTYVDTSVLGGPFDREFKEDSEAFMDCIVRGRIAPVLSDVVMGEVSDAPRQVQRLLNDLIDGGAEMLKSSEDAVKLQEAYLKSGVLARSCEHDAMHVALATVARVDVIASWNFKHLLDPRRSRGFNGVNLIMGYGLLSVLSPSDIVRYLENRK